jgi:hypothetical protein
MTPHSFCPDFWSSGSTPLASTSDYEAAISHPLLRPASTPLIGGSFVRTSTHVRHFLLQLKDRAREFLPVFTPVTFIAAAVLRHTEFTTGEDSLSSLPSPVPV